MPRALDSFCWRFSVKFVEDNAKKDEGRAATKIESKFDSAESSLLSICCLWQVGKHQILRCWVWGPRFGIGISVSLLESNVSTPASKTLSHPEPLRQQRGRGAGRGQPINFLGSLLLRKFNAMRPGARWSTASGVWSQSWGLVEHLLRGSAMALPAFAANILSQPCGLENLSLELWADKMNSLVHGKV